MAPPHTSRILREDRNAKIYSLHTQTDWGADRIVKATGVARSTVRGIIKRGDERGGDLHDAPQAGGPTKITDAKRRKVKAIVDEDPRLPLQEITFQANTGLGHSTVDKIISDAKFQLLVPRKKPFWRKGQKEKWKDFCFRDFGKKRHGGKLSLWMSAPLNMTLVQLGRGCV